MSVWLCEKCGALCNNPPTGPCPSCVALEAARTTPEPSPALKDQVLELLRDPEVKAAVDGWLKERLAVFSDNLAERIREEGTATEWVERPTGGGWSIGGHLEHELSRLGRAFGRAVREEMKQ